MKHRRIFFDIFTMKRQRLPELKLFIRFDSVKSTQTMHISYSCSVLSQNASFQRYFPILRKKINRKIAFRVLHQNPSKHTNFIELSIIRVHCSWIHFHFSCVDTTTFLRHQTHEKKQFWSFVYSQSACFCISFFYLFRIAVDLFIEITPFYELSIKCRFPFYCLPTVKKE